MSGEKQKLYADSLWELACRVAASLRWRPGSRPISCGCTPSKCGSGLARDAVDLAVALLCFALASDLPPLSQRPNAGVAQGAPRQGCRGSRPRPWMADGGGPPEQCLRYGMPSLGVAPNGGAEALWLLSRFSKVTRRKGGTNSRRYRRNGYAPQPKKQKKGRHNPTLQRPEGDR
jgi:hypothetical protein